jgi:hypothetical protein
MESLMETLMARENSRNCSRRTKHQLSALVNPRTDKTPARGFMVPTMRGSWFRAQCCRVGSRCRAGKAMRPDKTPAHGVHGCDHEPLMTAPRPLVSEITLMSKGAWRYLTQR